MLLLSLYDALGAGQVSMAANGGQEALRRAEEMPARRMGVAGVPRQGFAGLVVTTTSFVAACQATCQPSASAAGRSGTHQP